MMKTLTDVIVDNNQKVPSFLEDEVREIQHKRKEETKTQKESFLYYLYDQCKNNPDFLSEKEKSVIEAYVEGKQD